MEPDTLHAVLAELARARPVFHSEADFQHSLAWAFHAHDPSAVVRLEFRPAWDGPRGYVDIWLRESCVQTAIELKYWTRPLRMEHAGEPFDLLNQGAQDLSRYDFVKDLRRLEMLVAAGLADRGYCIALTNDASFWQSATRDTIDSAFRLHEGRQLTGRLAWSDQAGAGTTRGRSDELEVTGKYALTWRPYSEVAEGRNGVFRYLLAVVTR